MGINNPTANALVRIEARRLSKELNIYVCQGKERYDFTKRSKQMVDAVSGANSKLYAFANKACPNGCKPSKNQERSWLRYLAYCCLCSLFRYTVEIIFNQGWNRGALPG
ncbi:MAG: hypothetical protein KME29_08940 [Calothrix sp. FI2-JRJ7]|jgi:hypothetical protein|nr:hypothetical protein [Calothrix sp. FI2-JRJ7]